MTGGSKSTGDEPRDDRASGDEAERAAEAERGRGGREGEDRGCRKRRDRGSWDRDDWDDEWDRGSWDRDDWDDEWDRGGWDRDDRGKERGHRVEERGGRGSGDNGRPGRDHAPAPAETRKEHLSGEKPLRYTPPGSEHPAQPRRSPERRLDKGHQIAFMLLAGIGLGAGIGYGVDRLIGTFPALMLVGVFVGFGIALYAVFIETR